MPTPRRARRLSVLALIAAFLVTLIPAIPVAANAAGTGLVISQVYGGGGNTGAQYTNDFIEIFNPTTSTVSVTGWSVQYASATGTGTFAATPISGTLLPGHYFLVQEASGGAVGVALPAPDATGTLNMSGTSGKVILASTATGLACNGGSTACSAAQLAQIVDLVGYGTANFFEGTAAAPTLSNTTAAFRAGGGCTDTDNNSADFTAGAPSPRNSASSANGCAVSTNPTGVGAASPSTVLAGGSTLLTVAVTPGTNPTSTGLAVTGDLSAIGGSATQPFFDDGSNGDLTAGDNTFSFQATVSGGTTPGARSLPASIADAQSRSGSASIGLTISAPAGAALVLSQVYGGGGNSGATYKNDFIEVFNRSASAVNLAGWSVQYASSTGTTWAPTPLSGTLLPGRYYLVQEAAGAAGTTPLPTPDAVGTVAMASGAAKVALVSSTTALSGACPTGGAIVDFVGYGTAANCSETAPTATLSNTTAAIRAGGGCTDTNNNSTDFTTDAPTPRNTGTSPNPCGPTNPAGIGVASPSTVAASATTLLTVQVQPGFDPTSTGLSVAGDLSSIGGSANQTFFDDGSHGDATPGDNTFSFAATVAAATSTGQKSLTIAITDAQGRSGSTSIGLTVASSCGATFTPIDAIQGSGLVTPLNGQSVTTEGVVVGDYEGPAPALQGFYVEDPNGDADPATSEGIFVFNGNNDSVNLGDRVRVTGRAEEFQDQTEIGSVGSIVVCSTGNSVATTDVTFPVASPDYLERFEGMLVRLPQTLYVTEMFQLGRFGQVLMSSGGKLLEPTNYVLPGPPAIAMQAANDLNKIIIDDARNDQNPDPILFGRGGNPLSASNTLRGGDTATGIVGVMTYGWAGNAASGNAYRVRPINALGGGVPNFQPANPRPAAPTVGGNVHVGAMNLLNYFNTFGTTACTGGVGGAVMECRGATSQAEFDRQWPKTVAAITGLDPDVLGIMEIENDGYGPTSAIADLVTKLNNATAPGKFAFIDVDAAIGQLNAMGTDAIKVGMIYQPAHVTPVGTTGALNSVAFVNGGDSAPRNRPSLAQAFQLNSNGERFIVDANHLKSKGSACDAPDTGDGQANCAIVRTNAANLLASWLASDPTGTGDPDVIILGDLNSYAKEDPIAALEQAGYQNLLTQFIGPDAYSYVFDGEWGYLDHALGSPSLTSQVAGVAEWHNNSDEPSVLDYTTSFKSPGQLVSLYAPDQFRISDHDPVIIGLNLNAPPTVDAGGPYTVAEGGSVTVSATGNDPEGGPLTYDWDLDNDGTFETPGQSATFSAASIDGPATMTIRVRATDPGGAFSVASATVNVQNVAPSATFNSPASVLAGFPFTLSMSEPSDPSAADTAAGFEYAFDCGSGYGAFGSASSATCDTATSGPADVGARIRDKDGGAREYRAIVSVDPSARSKIEAVLAEVNALSVGAGKPDAGKLQKAADALTKALDPNLWIDPMHVVSKDGVMVFDRLTDAATPLQDLLKDKHSNVPDATLQGMIDDLVGASAMLARTAVDDATAAGAPADKIAKATDELAKADAAVVKGDALGAIDHYKKAWQRAQDAMK